MCFERGLGSASRERPVDRPEPCYCLVPESVQVILERIQILSFEASTGGQNAVKPFPLSAPVPNGDPRQLKCARQYAVGGMGTTDTGTD